MTKTLTKSTRCHHCGERMEAGDAFAWYEKPAFRVSRYKTLPSRWVVVHTNPCLIEQREREQAEYQAKMDAERQEIERLLVAGDIDGALALALGKAA